MKPTTFLQLSQKECSNLYKSIIDNSERHFKIAKILSKHQEYGAAVSHLVLGAEEMVKALVVYYDGLGLRIRSVKGIKGFFQSHKPRHLFSSMFVMMTYSLKSTMQLFQSYKQIKIDTDCSGNKLNAIEMAMMTNEFDIAETVKAFWENEGKNYLDRIGRELDFWEDADNYKMKGFYVDYNGVLETPEDISRDEYQIALKTTNYFRNECMNIINATKDLEQKEREQLITEFNKKEFYNLIEQMIRGTKVDVIEKIGIDENNRLYIKPTMDKFPLMHRIDMRIHCNSSEQRLLATEPEGLTYLDSYQHIIHGVKKEYNCILRLTDATIWENIDDELKEQILNMG